MQDVVSTPKGGREGAIPIVDISFLGSHEITPPLSKSKKCKNQEGL